MHDWLPLDDVTTGEGDNQVTAAGVLSWTKVQPGSKQAAVVERCRLAAAQYVEDVRKDLFDAAAPPVFQATDRVVLAGMLATARLYDRVGTASGVAFSELGGAGLILRYDPDVDRLLEIGPFAKPAVG